MKLRLVQILLAAALAVPSVARGVAKK